VFHIKQDFLINEEIEFSKVQVVDSNGQRIGLLPISKAIELAEEEGYRIGSNVHILRNAQAQVFNDFD